MPVSSSRSSRRATSRSRPCRDELEKFFRAEANHGRQDLVLPVYYMDRDTLENADLRAADPLAAAIHKRQRHDWRPLRFRSFNTKTLRESCEKLAEIVRARRRTMPEATTPGPRVRGYCFGCGIGTRTPTVVPSPQAAANNSVKKEFEAFLVHDAGHTLGLIVEAPL